MKVLLHICCAVCASSALQRLQEEGYEVQGYFYNPNIQPRQEYLQRLKETERLFRRIETPLIIGDYIVEHWFSQIKGWEDEPEGGRRCSICFRLRLQATAKIAQDAGFSAFTTTLTVSPHKNAQAINKIGQNIDQRRFLVRDFKKRDGFKKAQELAQKYRLYHQDYCGCVYSVNATKTDGAKQGSALCAESRYRGVKR